MLKNNFKIAWRNLIKSKIYSAINILGLALGMAVTIMIGLWINDEFTFNNAYTNKARIAQVWQSQTFNGQISTGQAIPLPLEFEVKEKHSDIFEHVVMSSWESAQFFNHGGESFSLNGFFMSKEILEVLDIEVIKGVERGLCDPKSLMISEQSAEALFGKEDPIGQLVSIDRGESLKVTAVYKNPPQHGSFSTMHYLMPWEYYTSSREWIRTNADNWDNNSFQMFVLLKEGVTMSQADAAIADTKKNAQPDNDHNPTLHINPMEEWHLYGEYIDGKKAGGRIENVWLFGIIGIFVLILACINFMNLSTARSEKRSLEVGIRKSIGSTRSQLIKQFLSESFLVVLLAYFLAIVIVIVSLSYFNEMANKNISFPYLNGWFWIFSLVFILVTALLAGSYPSLYLSSFTPVKVLKGTFKSGRYAALPRKILVVTQFTVSITLIIGTLIVLSQIEYSKNRPMGYDKAGLIQVPIFSHDFNGKYDFSRTQFMNCGAVTAFASSLSPVTEVWSNTAGYKWDGKPEGFQEDFAMTHVSWDYIETMGMEIIEGRDFSRNFATDSNAVILNETAVKYMQIQDPIGKLLIDNASDDPEPPLKIIGVVRDAIIQSPYEPVKQHIYPFDKYDNSAYYQMRLNPENSVAENLAIVEKVFKEHFPNVPFQYDFIDENFARKFENEERVAGLSKLFTILAIIISCLGLFGLASFVAEQRTKEIGVRKVLGASVANLWLLLSKDFLLLVCISILIAAPLAYYFMNGWIERFSYRTDISVDVFLLAGIGALILTLITVSFQAIKAAVANPVKSLKTE
ncbi:ABC transporter permease [Nonlabens spongiae]|uniref:ABC transporter permease n=1 Tax=Nonlabens spongiae TaxID=331648 RepID=A0A1W6MNH7_9FLAO|nr:FtsX-like permease family protein [Nonlabens spongiae]ARN79160.1 ABC transporter permease [Nonlabens spongiae]